MAYSKLPPQLSIERLRGTFAGLAVHIWGCSFSVSFWAEFEERMFVRFSFVQVCPSPSVLVLYIALRPGTYCCPTPVISGVIFLHAVC